MFLLRKDGGYERITAELHRRKGRQMITFLSMYGLGITIIGTIVGLIMFFESRRYPRLQQPRVVVGVVALIMILMIPVASVLANISSPPPTGYGADVTPTPTSDNSHPTTGVTPGQVTPTPTVQVPTPTPTPTPHDEKMEWTTNWSDWAANGDNWYISGNSLMATGNGQMIITAPLVPIAADYAVEVDITVDNVNHSAYYGGFGILVRSSGGHGGYALSMCYAGGWNSCQGSDHAAILSAGCDFNQYVVGGENCSVLGATPYHAPTGCATRY